MCCNKADTFLMTAVIRQTLFSDCCIKADTIFNEIVSWNQADNYWNKEDIAQCFNKVDTFLGIEICWKKVDTVL